MSLGVVTGERVVLGRVRVWSCSLVIWEGEFVYGKIVTKPGKSIKEDDFVTA
jgi:hypothetical protein